MRKKLRKIEKLHMVLKAHLTGKKEFKMRNEDFQKAATICILDGDYHGAKQEIAANTTFKSIPPYEDLMAQEENKSNKK